MPRPEGMPVSVFSAHIHLIDSLCINFQKRIFLGVLKKLMPLHFTF